MVVEFTNYDVVNDKIIINRSKIARNIRPFLKFNGRGMASKIMATPSINKDVPEEIIAFNTATQELYHYLDKSEYPKKDDYKSKKSYEK